MLQLIGMLAAAVVTLTAASAGAQVRARPPLRTVQGSAGARYFFASRTGGTTSALELRIPPFRVELRGLAATSRAAYGAASLGQATAGLAFRVLEVGTTVRLRVDAVGELGAAFAERRGPKGVTRLTLRHVVGGYGRAALACLLGAVEIGLTGELGYQTGPILLTDKGRFATRDGLVLGGGGWLALAL